MDKLYIIRLMIESDLSKAISQLVSRKKCGFPSCHSNRMGFNVINGVEAVKFICRNAMKKYGITVQIWIPIKMQVFVHIALMIASIKLLNPPVKRIHNLSKQVCCRVAKLWQRDGIAAVETESRCKIQFFMADEGRSSIVKSSPLIFMSIFLFCALCVRHDCHVPSGRSGKTGRPESKSVSSQCRVGAGC